ncbi:MAG TPA: GYDIA family GHMP kinase [Flavobacterium sp.]|nr:GYDIA family GHMP kinase [Flavobacterium sp.]
MKQAFYSNGKLLVTGEYLVLDGAVALALPTKMGQDLTVEEGTGRELQWKSFDHDGSIWFSGTIAYESILQKEHFATDRIKDTLAAILHEASRMNPKLLEDTQGFKISTSLTFPRLWGLGTSSTLINNIAQWFGIDAFELLKNSFGGSGYDIANAQNSTPILYRLENKKPIVVSAPFNPSFSEQLYFVYLNKKQDSSRAIASYREKQKNISGAVAAIDAATHAILAAADLETFQEAMLEHERIMSAVLGIKTVQQALFPDFAGCIKSLGAWGGDFILAASKEDPADYFKSRGFGTILHYREMIL